MWATRLATIQDSTHMGAEVANYSLEAGLADVYGYYDAGTVVGALQGIAESVGQDHTEAEAIPGPPLWKIVLFSTVPKPSAKTAIPAFLLSWTLLYLILGSAPL